MLSKAYVEITNVCNLNCSFCPKTKRKAGVMSPSEFAAVADKLAGHVEYVYLHLMGEPMLHPQLDEILSVCDERGFKVIITTNGTLAGSKNADVLVASPAVYKISVSVHSFEANEGTEADSYLKGVFELICRAADAGKIAVMRLWNLDGDGTVGENRMNDGILAAMHGAFPDEWIKTRSGSRVAERTYLEWGEKFEWPDEGAEDRGGEGYCYGVHTQIGILVDGTVVPCCLDHEGDIPLGNIFESTLDEILSSPRARAMAEGFKNRVFTESLCRKCGFARKF